MTMLDHVIVFVRDLARSRAFYDHALAPIGYAALYSFDATTPGAKLLGYGAKPKTAFWIVEKNVPPMHMHIAFTAPSRAAVDAFHRAGLDAGGIDNGAPGLRPH